MNRRMLPDPYSVFPTVALLALLSLSAGCERQAEPPPREVVLAREQAERGACAANELLQRASDDVESLQESWGGTSEGPSLVAGAAALEFARTHLQHAQLRTGRLAHLDSAYNHSRRAADSSRHVQVAHDLAPGQPEPGTLEANVRSSFDRQFRAIFEDPDHPCNWDLED